MVQRWRVVDDQVELRLNTGEALTVAVATLAPRLEGAHTLVVALPEGREARLGRRAWTAVSADLDVTEEGAVQWQVGGQVLAVRTDAKATTETAA